jgi:hypothetical protein
LRRYAEELRRDLEDNIAFYKGKAEVEAGAYTRPPFSST